MKKRLYFLAALMLCLTGALKAQNGTDSLTFTGTVFDRVTLETLDDAVYFKGHHTYGLQPGGKFRVKAAVGDTIIFSYLGYKDLIVTLDDSLANNDYLMGVYLSPVATMLSEVVIVPRYYSLDVLVAIDPVKQAKEQAYAERNLKMSAYQGLLPATKMDNEMNQKMTIEKHRMDVEYKQMLSPNQMVGVNFFTVVPETKEYLAGLREKGLALDLGKITTQEEENYLRSIFKAMQLENKANRKDIEIEDTLLNEEIKIPKND
ncbi:hypothetical protein ACE1ET_16195 [Saccharicrinis sp. FJH62]|uniref:hypothetical protein n=1 Tax=Saccharicrinis sp. FJH62 TaxID=3344657 RepID=UPI0035D4EAEC